MRAESHKGGAAALVITDLRREFGGVQAVDGATFDVPPGQITGLIGPNGAGKSTVLKMVAGAIRPTSGSIRYADAEIAGWPAHRIARQGVIRTFQLSSEFGRLTVLENLLTAAPDQRGDSFGGALLGPRYWRGQQAELVERARHMLDRFDLISKQDELAGELSGGQKRLVEIMRGLMAEPKLLLLDEPMAGVNPSLCERVEEHLMRLRDEGLTMLMVEHELGSVERTCDSVVVMAQGRVLTRGSMREIRENQEVLDAYLVG